MADVFISYKRDERQAVERLAAKLRELGLNIWFDASMSAGETFNSEIDREARAAKAILVCWSPTARESRWVIAEAMIGFEQDKLAACHVAGPDGFSPPTPFNTSHAEDLRAWLAAPSETHAGWKSVLRRIGKLCGRLDIESWGALDAQASAAELRAWIGAHEQSPLYLAVESMLRDRETQDGERARLEKVARERQAREEAERRAQVERDARARREVEERTAREASERAREAEARQAGRSSRLIWWAIAGVVVLFLGYLGASNLGISTNTTEATSEPSTQTPLAFVSPTPDRIVHLSQPIHLTYQNAEYTIAMLRDRIRTTAQDGTALDHTFSNFPGDPSACSFIPTSLRVVVFCREVDWGVIFASFMDPHSPGPLTNVLNPAGRAYHLPNSCAEPPEPQEHCYATIDRLHLLITTAYYGYEGSNVLAFDLRGGRVI